MITAIRLLLISSVTSQLPLFVIVRSVEIYSFSVSTYNTVLSITITMLYIGSPEFIIPGRFVFFDHHFPMSLSPVPGNHNSTFCFLSSVFLNSTYTWCHILFISIQFISVSTMPSRVVSDGRISFIFDWILFHCIYCLYHIFFIFSSISGLLGCFHLVYLMLQWTWGCKYLFKK